MVSVKMQVVSPSVISKLYIEPYSKQNLESSS
jgi:hypothetical protein